MKFFLFPVLSALALQGVGLSAYADVKEFDTKNLAKMTVQNPSGNVTISAIEKGNATVTFNKKKFSNNCKMTLEKDGKNLLVKVQSEKAMSSDACDVDFEIKVPKAMDLDLAGGTSDFIVANIDGKLDFKSGSGNLNADGNFHEIDARAGSGDINVKGLNKGGKLREGSGNINLSFVQSVKKGKLDILTGSGDVTLFFPKSASVDADLKSGSGQLSSDFPNNGKGLFKISMKSGSGNLNIKEMKSQ